MQLEQLVLPTLATIALGAALLVPLRDGRKGKRATLAGFAPLRADFAVLDERRSDQRLADRSGETDKLQAGASFPKPLPQSARAKSNRYSLARLFRSFARSNDAARAACELDATKDDDTSRTGHDRTLASREEHERSMVPAATTSGYVASDETIDRANTAAIFLHARSATNLPADRTAELLFEARAKAERDSVDVAERIAFYDGDAVRKMLVAYGKRCARFFGARAIVATTTDIDTQISERPPDTPLKTDVDASFLDRAMTTFTMETRDLTSSGTNANEGASGSSTIERSFEHELDNLLRPIPASEIRELPRIASIARPHAVHAENVPSTGESHVTDLAEPDTRGTPAAIYDERSETPSQAHVVRAQRPSIERILPLTRLPLRPQSSKITWPTLLDTGATSAIQPSRIPSDRTARRTLLAELVRNRRDDAPEALRTAYREEDADGRSLALRALLQYDVDDASHAIFLEALRSGSDDERSIAVDALSDAGDRDALLLALDDRIDAIAAKAALAYVNSSEREAYGRFLGPYLDRGRIETILALLAGFVE